MAINVYVLGYMDVIKVQPTLTTDKHLFLYDDGEWLGTFDNIPAIVNFSFFGSLEVISITHLSPVDWVLYTSLAWQWWMAEAPLIFSGLSMMKLPFHTMERSTARSLIFTPSYMYCNAEQRVRECAISGSRVRESQRETEDRGEKRYRE